MKRIEIVPHVLTLVCSIMVSMLITVIEAFINILSSVVNNPDHLIAFWRGAMILLFSKKRRGLQCIQVPLSNCIRRGGSNSWILLEIFFHHTILILLWIPNSLLSWILSPIIFISGLPLSLFFILRVCTS